jgi:hypothetical protein
LNELQLQASGAAGEAKLARSLARTATPTEH